MHSKVIIASLVCMLAASFGNGKYSNVSKNYHAKTNESVSLAPNDYHQTVSVVQNEYGNAGSTVSVVIDSENSLGNSVGIDDATEGLIIHYSINSGAKRVNFTVVAPTQAGDYFVRFADFSLGKYILLGSVYIYSDGTHFYASTLSANDARAKFFMEYMATNDERNYLLDGRNEYFFNSQRNQRSFAPGKAALTKAGISDGVGGIIDKGKFDPIGPIGPIKPIPTEPKEYEPTKFDAEKRFGDFVYGTNDIVTTRRTTPASTGTGQNLTLRLHVNWIDENNASHPLSGMWADFVTPENVSFATTLSNGVSHMTDANGVYEVPITATEARSWELDEVQFKLVSVNKATFVEDGFVNNYAYCFSLKENVMTGPMLYSIGMRLYSAVDFYVTIHPERSDRAAAYEICQAQALPYQYADDFTYGVNQVRTVYPAAHTEYHDEPWYNYYINVQKEDYASWDVLNHEYGHYIADMMCFGYSFSTPGNRYVHTIHQNLVNKYGANIGKKLAFSEGIATYLAIASQLYFQENNPNVSIPNVGDEVYEDLLRGLRVDYNLYAPAKVAGSGAIQINAVESAVTSTLLKLMDDTNRNGDFVAMGHENMMNVLFTSWPNTLDDVLDGVRDFYAGSISDINCIVGLESNQYQAPQPNSMAEWTIMIYACGSSLCGFESGNIWDIINVPGQPYNVNVIIETGGTEELWGVEESNNQYIPNNQITRYHLRNNHLVRDAGFNQLADDNMGAQGTFESFLNWGLSNYPARNTGIILVNHGGAITGVCHDDRHDGDKLLNSETSAAFENAFRRNSIQGKLEFIGYDACMMQLQDIAEFNSRYFKYMMASQIPTSEMGWSYAPLIRNIYNYQTIKSNPSLYPDGVTLTALKESAKLFITNGYKWEQTLSILDLSYMGEYYDAFEDFADCLMYKIDIGAIDSSSIANCLFLRDIYGEGSYGSGDCVEMLLNVAEYADYQLQQKINAVLSFFPNNGDYEPYIYNTVIGELDGYTVVESNSLVKFYAASKSSAGNPPVTRGLAVCVGASSFKLDEPYPQAETNFNSWREVVLLCKEGMF